MYSVVDIQYLYLSKIKFQLLKNGLMAGIADPAFLKYSRNLKPAPAPEPAPATGEKLKYYFKLAKLEKPQTNLLFSTVE